MIIQYDADQHCRKHAEAQYGKKAIATAIAMQKQHDLFDIVKDNTLYNAHPHDSEGNLVYIIHRKCKYCSECAYEKRMNSQQV